MTAYSYLGAACALLLVGAAAAIDHRTGFIPNRLTVTGMLVGIALAVLGGGPLGGLLAVAGALAVALVPLLLFHFGAMGGGDVKLFAALGALLGAAAALETELVSFVFGAIQGVVVWARHGRLGEGLRGVVLLVCPGVRRRWCGEVGGVFARTTEIRLGPAILAATGVVLVWRMMGV